jgi:hypothetical protein
MLGGLAGFQRDLIRTRTGEGRAFAGAHRIKMGRKPKMMPHRMKEAIRRGWQAAAARYRQGFQRLAQHDIEIDLSSMRSPLGYRPINPNDPIYMLANYVFNFVQWAAVTSVIVYAGQRTHSIYLQSFGFVLQILLYVYMLRLAMNRIEPRFWKADSKSWKQWVFQVVTWGVFGMLITCGAQIAFSHVITDLVHYQTCS